MWQNWSNCNVACGPGGKRVRKRYCTNPHPQNGGRDCEGKMEETEECKNNPPCPIDCEVSQWGKWTPCSVTCGTPGGSGYMNRYRHYSVLPQHGGKPCPTTTLLEVISLRL